MTSIRSLKFLLISLTILSLSLDTKALESDKMSTVDIVKFVEGREAEARYFYHNNWLELRQAAKQQGLIDDFTFIETTPTKETPYNALLITTYRDQAQYDAREENFQKLMANRQGPKLLNNLRPKEFRIAVHNLPVAKTIN